MTDQEKKEGNILMAKFLGWELSTDGRKLKFEDRYPYGYVKAHPDHLYFDFSFDWLSPVLEKIEQIDYVGDIEIHSSACIIHADKVFKHRDISFTPYVEAAWLCAVDFIKWHNTINDK